MNDWNNLENQLKAWRLRPPSRRLEARLFGQASRRTTETAIPTARHWLVPAMAVCLLVLLLAEVNPTGGTHWQHSLTSNLLATVSLNQPLLARYYAPTLQHDRNTWPKATFDWTNGSHALTSAAPFLNGKN